MGNVENLGNLQYFYVSFDMQGRSELGSLQIQKIQIGTLDVLVS